MTQDLISTSFILQLRMYIYPVDGAMGRVIQNPEVLMIQVFCFSVAPSNIIDAVV